MLIKTSKSNLPFFKQHFCKHPSKLANLADFVTQNKKPSFSRIFQVVKISKKKKMSDFCDANFDPMDLFFFLLFFCTIYGVKACYFFLDFQNLFKTNGKKGYCDHSAPHLRHFPEKTKE